MSDNKNTIIAIALSALVLLAWQYFVTGPQQKVREEQQQAQKQELAQKQAAQPGQPAQPVQAPAGLPQAPGQTGQAPAVSSASRAEALKGSPRIPIMTDSLQGSIALKGGRIDDLSLSKFRETVDPKSPPIVLLSPSGSADPFYAEFGWTGAAGSNVKLPTGDTLWTQDGSGALSVGHPVTLTYDDGEGLQFRRTISVDDKYLFTVHGRGGEQERQRGDALSLRADLTPRHAASRRLLHSARRPYRLSRQRRLAGIHLQEDGRPQAQRGGHEEHRFRCDQWLARHHRQILGGDAAAADRRQAEGALHDGPDRQHTDLPDRLSARGPYRAAGRHRLGQHAAVRRRQGSARRQRLRESAQRSTTSIC